MTEDNKVPEVEDQGNYVGGTTETSSAPGGQIAPDETQRPSEVSPEVAPVKSPDGPLEASGQGDDEPEVEMTEGMKRRAERRAKRAAERSE